MRLTNLTIENRLKSIGYYQIVGGAIGLLITIYVLVMQATISGLTLFFIIIASFLYSFSIYCGNLLRKLDLKGLDYSTWNQVLQIFSFGLLGIGFKYFSGIFFKFGFEWTDSFTPSFKFGISSWTMSYLPSKMHEIIVFVNVVPIVILSLIFKTEKEIEARRELIEIASQKPISEKDNKNDLNE